MDQLDFDFYSTTSFSFGIIGVCALLAGLYSPRTLAFCLKNRIVSYSFALILLLAGILCLTAIAWLVAGRLGFAGFYAREALTLYTVGLVAGSIWMRKV